MTVDDGFHINDLTRVVHLYLTGKARGLYWIYKHNNRLCSCPEMRLMKIDGRLNNRLSKRQMLSCIFHNMHPSLQNV